MVRYTYTRLPVPATHPTPHDVYRTTLGNQLLRRPKTFLLLLLTTVIGGAFWASLNEDYQATVAIRKSPPDWETLYRSAQRGWTVLSPDPYLAPSPQPLLAIDRFSPGCLDDWVANGALCHELHGEFKDYSVDVLYSYVNGTDELMKTWREGVAANVRSGRPALEKRQGRRVGPGGMTRKKVGPSLDKKAKHFRDHDELRYSIRSLLSVFLPTSITKIILLTADVPLYSLPLAPSHSSPPNSTLVFPPDTTRIGQIPQWLDENTLKNGRKKPELRMAYQSEAFGGGKSGSVTGVPSFSSLAIESRMVNVPGLGEHVFYMNDDCFIMNPLAATDVASPLFGPLSPPKRLTSDGYRASRREPRLRREWPGLGHANWLLDQRFGTRKRNYLAHIAKTFSTPLLKEAQTMWADEFDQTSQSRFRGMAPEFQTLFLSTHYTIERHREALLWSFFVARSDQNRDGSLSLAERHSMLTDLGFKMDETKSSSAEIVVPFPHRRGRSAFDKIRQDAGLEEAKQTQVDFDSRDGYVSFSTHLPRFYDRTNNPLPFPVVQLGSVEGGEEAETRDACAFVIKECLGSSFLSEKKEVKTVDVFRKVAFEEVHCGDCAVLALLGKSGPEGLSAFLPPAETNDKDDDLPLASSIPPLGGKATTHERFTHLPSDLTGNLRHKSLVLIQRYAYTIGTSSSRLLTLTTQGLAISALSTLNKELAASYNRKEPPPPATFVTINDNTMSERGVELVDIVLAKFFRFQWPKKSVYERD